MDILARIKRAIIGHHYVFTDKADVEMDRDDLTERDVLESIVTATAVHKTVRSTSPARGHPREKLYVIINTNLSGTLIYSKGAFRFKAGVGTFYLLVSAKQAL